MTVQEGGRKGHGGGQDYICQAHFLLSIIEREEGIEEAVRPPPPPTHTQ